VGRESQDILEAQPKNEEGSNGGAARPIEL
jgi:hypothetical protein